MSGDPVYTIGKYGNFHRSRIKPNVINKVVRDDHQLTQVNSAKYLGVIIDHKLNWIEHISYVKK